MSALARQWVPVPVNKMLRKITREAPVMLKANRAPLPASARSKPAGAQRMADLINTYRRFATRAPYPVNQLGEKPSTASSQVNEGMKTQARLASVPNAQTRITSVGLVAFGGFSTRATYRWEGAARNYDGPRGPLPCHSHPALPQ